MERIKKESIVKKGLVVVGAFVILFSLISLFLLINDIILKQDKVTFTVSKKVSYIKKPTGTVEVSSRVLLFWPAIFITGGLVSILSGLGLKKLSNLFFSLVFLLLGLLFVFLNPLFPFNLIAWTLSAFGVLMTIGSLRGLRWSDNGKN